MKPIYSTRTFLQVVFFSIALMSISMGTNAQNRRKDKFEKGNNHKEYRDDRHFRNDHADERNYRGDDHKKYYRENRSDRREYSEHYYQGQNHYRDYYDHPKYGRVYQRFDHDPYVFRHSHDNYYYYNNRFYTYRDGIGYCASEPPRHVYFRELPFQCSRYYSNGREYYRNGDLFFRLSSRGYIMVPAPVEVSLSVHF